MEMDPSARFARLELDAAGSLVTLHPDGLTGTAHGNIVESSGVRPLTIDWRDGAGISIDGDPFGSTLCPGVGDPLTVSASGVRWARATEALPRDDRGVPVLAEAQEWALEE